MTTATYAPSRHKAATGVQYKDDDLGEVVAKFSTFDIADREGDVVRRSAFTDGQPVAMVWAHDWTKPIGRGVIRVRSSHAEFLGSFLPTNAGQEARAAVRAMGDLQQWSWGFRVLATQPNTTIRGNDITKAEIFEVSPVLVGANPWTATLTVKGERGVNKLAWARSVLKNSRSHTLHEVKAALAYERLELERDWLNVR